MADGCLNREATRFASCAVSPISTRFAWRLAPSMERRIATFVHSSSSNLGRSDNNPSGCRIDAMCSTIR